MRAPLLELQGSLKEQGLDLPHWQLVSAADTNIHLGVLSKFRFQASHPHTNVESFLLNGRRFHLSRGFAEIDFVLESGYRFSVIAAHLKSKRLAAAADEAEMSSRKPNSYVRRSTPGSQLTRKCIWWCWAISTTQKTRTR